MSEDRGEDCLRSTYFIQSSAHIFTHKDSWEDKSWFYSWQTGHVWCICSNL